MDRTIYIPGPEPTLKLIHSDVWLPGLYSRRVLCFALPPTSSHEKAISVITRALESLVQGLPELGSMSVVVPSEDNSQPPWRALVPHKGIELVVKDLSKSFMTFQQLSDAGYPISAFKDDVFMPIAAPIMPEPQPQAKFQINLIEGGILLSCCIYHHLTDGNGMNTIMRALGEECAKAARTDEKLAPRILETDRSLIMNLNGQKTDISEHPAYKIAPGIWTPGASHDADQSTDPLPEFAPGYFRIEHDKAEDLKIAGSASIPVSTHDAISALLWRTLVIAKHKSGRIVGDEISTFTVPHNGRRHLGLPKEWVGNCVYFISADMPVSEILKEGSLPIMAAKIRTALNKVDKELVAGMMQLRRQDPYGLNWWPVFEPIDKHIVAITSFYHSELLGTDWGPALGEVRHFTTTDIGAFSTEFQAGHFVGPKLPGGRGCDVYTGLLKEDARFFLGDELWNQYFRPLASASNGHG